MRTRLYRLGTWGDRKHWEMTVGRVCVERWCEGAPCSLVPGRHPVTVRLWNRAGATARR